MKRKAALFLLAVIVAVTLGATLVIALTMYHLVHDRQKHEISNIEASLGDRFSVFDMLLRSEHGRIDAHMAVALPLIAEEVGRLGPSPDKLSQAQLDAVSAKYGVEDIYLIDRSHKIFQTN